MADTSLLLDNERQGCLNGFPKYYLAAFSSWFGSIALGTVIGYTSPAIPNMQLPNSHLQITDDEASWAGSLMAVGAAFGAGAAG